MEEHTSGKWQNRDLNSGLPVTNLCPNGHQEAEAHQSAGKVSVTPLANSLSG